MRLIDKFEELRKPSKQEIERQEYFYAKKRLANLSEDIVQELVGLTVPNMEDKKSEFINLYNTVCKFEGKIPKEAK